MEYASWGDGPRSLLYLPGGPGSSVSAERLPWVTRRWFAPFVEAGYTVWQVTRRRGMPAGHTVEDMADDYADVVAEELGGRVDLVVGVSYGGMVGQHLAARHGDALGRLALIASAAEVTDWGKEVDARLLAALERDDVAGFGAAFAEYALPGDRSRWLRRLAGPWIGRGLLSGKHYPPSDLAVELAAEIAFDARAALPGIATPTLLVAGDRDRFFADDVVDETARLIPDCALVRHDGSGHLKVAGGRRAVQDVLAFAG
jgi:pimeloyl-ACP methyl ester carboxylesterase